MAEFDRLFGESVLRSTRLSSTRLDLALAGEAEPEAWELAARETGCCSFFRFGFESVGADVVMRIEVPHSHVELLDALARRVDAMAGGEVRLSEAGLRIGEVAAAVGVNIETFAPGRGSTYRAGVACPKPSCSECC